MPPTRAKKNKVPDKPLYNIKDPQEIICELESKLETLQRNYEKCQTKLGKVLQENKELRKQVLRLEGCGGKSKIKITKDGGEKKSSSSVRRSSRRPPKPPEYSEDRILPQKEEDQDHIEERDQSPIHIKEEDMIVDYDNIMNQDDDNGSEGYSPFLPTNQDPDDSSNEDEEIQKETEDVIYPSRNPKRIVRKKRGSKANAEIGRRKKERTEEKTQNLIPPTGLEIDIVNFLDDILSNPGRTIGRPFPAEDISLFDTTGLDAFEVVLRKKLDFCLRGEVKKLAPSLVEVEVPKTRLKYFSTPPTADPYIKPCFRPKRAAKLKPSSDIDVPPIFKPPSNRIKRARAPTKSSDLPPAFKPLLCSTFVAEELQPYICELCGASLDTLAKFNRHKISHSEAIHPCPVCGKLFKRKDDMNKHVKGIHERVYRFQCQMCPKQFTDASGFRRHERSHLNIKPHLCSVCGRRFPELKNLRMHTLSQHNNEKELPHRVKPI